MAHLIDHPQRQYALPHVRSVPLARFGHWLAAGWYDLMRTPLASFAYGILFSLGGDLLLISLWRSPAQFAIAVSGFLLVAPLLCAGLYELSRRSERGLESRLVDSLAVFRDSREGLALFALLLLLLWGIWAAFSLALFAGVADGASVIEFVRTALASQLTVAWFAVGGVLALTVFMLGVVSVPMLIDRHCDFVSAAMTSLRAIAANPLPLLLWATVIAALALLGFVSALFGLVVFMPLLGHASWHAYRDLVE